MMGNVCQFHVPPHALPRTRRPGRACASHVRHGMERPAARLALPYTTTHLPSHIQALSSRAERMHGSLIIGSVAESRDLVARTVPSPPRAIPTHPLTPSVGADLDRRETTPSSPTGVDHVSARPCPHRHQAPLRPPIPSPCRTADRVSRPKHELCRRTPRTTRSHQSFVGADPVSALINAVPGPPRPNLAHFPALTAFDGYRRSRPSSPTSQSNAGFLNKRSLAHWLSAFHSPRNDADIRQQTTKRTNAVRKHICRTT